MPQPENREAFTHAAHARNEFMLTLEAEVPEGVNGRIAWAFSPGIDSYNWPGDFINDFDTDGPLIRREEHPRFGRVFDSATIEAELAGLRIVDVPDQRTFESYAEAAYVGV